GGAHSRRRALPRPHRLQRDRHGDQSHQRPVSELRLSDLAVPPGLDEIGQPIGDAHQSFRPEFMSALMICRWKITNRITIGISEITEADSSTDQSMLSAPTIERSAICSVYLFGSFSTIRGQM